VKILRIAGVLAVSRMTEKKKAVKILRIAGVLAVSRMTDKKSRENSQDCRCLGRV
jgi:hypothetical protein